MNPKLKKILSSWNKEEQSTIGAVEFQERIETQREQKNKSNLSVIDKLKILQNKSVSEKKEQKNTIINKPEKKDIFLSKLQKIKANNNNQHTPSSHNITQVFAEEKTQEDKNDFIPMSYNEKGEGISPEVNMEHIKTYNEVPPLYVNFHHHDEYSVKHALGTVKEMIPLLKNRHQTHYAVSNYGEVSGWTSQYFTCKDNDIIPILGMEIMVNNYVFDNEMLEYRGYKNTWKKPLTEVSDDDKCLAGIDYNLVLYARTLDGYYNLIQCHNKSQLENFYRRPRIWDKFLSTHGSGIVCVLPVPFSEVGSLIYNGMWDEAKNKYDFYKSCFDDIYLELPMTNDESYKDIYNNVIQFSKKFNVSLLLTTNSHYIHKNDKDVYDTLTRLKKIKRNIVYYDIDFNTNMSYLFENDLQQLYETQWRSKIFTQQVFDDAFNNVIKLASTFSLLDINTEPKMPTFPNAESVMREKAVEGLKKLGLDNKPEYCQRLEYELDNIIRAGFADYFLFLEDVCVWCNHNNILRGPSRGCFTPNMRITMADGFYKFISDVQQGDMVVSGNNNIQLVLEQFEYDIDEEIIDLELDDGRIISCTLEHKIKVFRNKCEIWVEAQNLSENDKIIEIL